MDQPIAKTLLEDRLELFQFMPGALQLVEWWCGQIAAEELSQRKFAEFYCLGAAEIAALNSVLSVTPRIEVGYRETVISVLCDDTTLGGACQEMKGRISSGKMEDRDLFLFGGDFSKFKELNMEVDQIREDPCGGIMGMHKPMQQFASFYTQQVWSVTRALRLQGLLWKLKWDIINESKTEDDILSWASKYDLRRRLEEAI